MKRIIELVKKLKKLETKNKGFEVLPILPDETIPQAKKRLNITNDMTFNIRVLPSGINSNELKYINSIPDIETRLETETLRDILKQCKQVKAE